MKRSLVAAALGLALTAGTAHAGGILDSFNLLNPSTATFVTIDTMDWSSSGSGYAEGLTPGPIAMGTNFTFDYQAFLSGVTLGGAAVAFPGLNTSFEYTIVARFGETVIDGSTGAVGDTAVFSTTGGTFGIYVNPTSTNAVVATGVGFDDTVASPGPFVASDGDLVASGTIDPGQISNFTPSSATTGIGSAIIQGILGFINPAYLDPISAGLELPLFDIRFEGTQNIPPLDSATTGFFIGGDPVLFPDIPVVPGELVFKVDGSSKFSVVPEPSTYLLVGMGLLGLVGYSRRRNKA